MSDYTPFEYEAREIAWARHEEALNEFMRTDSWEREEQARAAFEETRAFESWCETADLDPNDPASADAYAEWLESFFPED